ncbi:SUMF1/EgtB/PvdO family nonheme iron enzyme [Fervidobacterium sp.]
MRTSIGTWVFLLFVLCIFLFVGSKTFAATIVYKDGPMLDGTLEDLNNAFVVVSNPFGKIQVPVSNIQSIVFKSDTIPESGQELSINGKKYRGYVTELSKDYAVVTTWFGKIKINLKSDSVDYLGFEKVELPSITSEPFFQVELVLNDYYICALVNGEMIVGTELNTSGDYISLVDSYKNTFFILKGTLEYIYIPYKHAKGYDLVVLNTGKKLYGIVKKLSDTQYEISGQWGKLVVNQKDIVFSTYKDTKEQTSQIVQYIQPTQQTSRIEVADILLEKAVYDRDGVATIVTDAPVKVEGKEVRKINIYPKEIVDPRTGITFVLIPGGVFKMGADASWRNVEEDELPQREVYVSAFYISKYPITVKQYLDFLKASQTSSSIVVGKQINPVEIDFLGQKVRVSYSAPATLLNVPITGINYASAKAYCDWAGYQLPTEAQWEKAARGTDGRRYPWGNESQTKYNDGRKDYPVDEFESVDISPYGVVNTYGYPIELCRDYYAKDAYKKLPKENPLNTTGTYVVGRAGALAGRITDRIPLAPSEVRNDVTFRVVMDAEEAFNIVKKPLNNKLLGITWFVVNENVKKQYNVKSEGLYVAFVETGSPAQLAGIKDGDVIVKIDGKTIKSPDDALKALSGKKQGDISVLTIDRGGKAIEIKVRLGAWLF